MAAIPAYVLLMSSPKCQPNWMKFDRNQLLYRVHLVASWFTLIPVSAWVAAGQMKTFVFVLLKMHHNSISYIQQITTMSMANP